jgi:hypothetical protein
MRFLILAALPVAALLAQAPSSAEQAQQNTQASGQASPPAQAAKPAIPDAAKLALSKKQLLSHLWDDFWSRSSGPHLTGVSDLRFAPGVGPRIVVRRPGQPCAVPLKNTLRDAPAKPISDPLPVTPGSPGAVPLKEATLPAPSCDDVKR